MGLQVRSDRAFRLGSLEAFTAELIAALPTIVSDFGIGDVRVLSQNSQTQGGTQRDLSSHLHIQVPNDCDGHQGQRKVKEAVPA